MVISLINIQIGYKSHKYNKIIDKIYIYIFEYIYINIWEICRGPPQLVELNDGQFSGANLQWLHFWPAHSDISPRPIRAAYAAITNVLFSKLNVQHCSANWMLFPYCRLFLNRPTNLFYSVYLPQRILLDFPLYLHWLPSIFKVVTSTTFKIWLWSMRHIDTGNAVVAFIGLLGYQFYHFMHPIQ